MKKKIVLSLGLTTAIFTGCGSSNGGGTSTGTGYYIDSAVSGVDYVCGTQKGKTGTDGSFTFEEGKSCTFSLGSLKLREVEAVSLRDQIRVLEDNLAVATLLQTLDSDGNPDNNGIVISAKIIEELKAKNITKLPENQNEVAVIYEIIKNVEGYKGSLKSADEAKSHLEKAQSSKLKELLAGKTFYNVAPYDYDLEELSFNDALTSTTWKTLYGDHVGYEETESIEVKGDKIVVKDGNLYIEKETSDYILIKADHDAGNSRLYFDKAKAKAYFDSLKKDIAAAPPLSLKSLLAGKKFFIHKGGKDDYLSVMIFNADATSATIKIIDGPNVGETRTRKIIVHNKEMTFEIEDSGSSTGFRTEYNIGGDNNRDYLTFGSLRFYYDKAKAEAYFNELENSNSTPK